MNLILFLVSFFLFKMEFSIFLQNTKKCPWVSMDFLRGKFFPGVSGVRWLTCFIIWITVRLDKQTWNPGGHYGCSNELEGVYTYPKWNSRRLEISKRRGFFFSFTRKIHGGVKWFLFHAGVGCKSYKTLLKIYTWACKYLFETFKVGVR